MKHSYAALIPLRGGSKGIPGKNIKPICGQPLCYWSLAAACACPSIATVAVSTEDAAIADTVRSLDLPVHIIDRPSALGSDDASTEAVMLHALEALDCTALVTLQATSPLTTAADLTAAITCFEREGCDSLLSAVRQHRFYWTPDGQPLNYDPTARPRRQDWDGSMVENGAFYITRTGLLKRSGCRLGGRIGVHAMPADTLAEIDEPSDWPLIEQALAARLKDQDPHRPIQLLVCDVDGTLTDAGMYYSEHGEELKKFNTRDFHGMAMLRERGVPTWIITKEQSDIVAARMRKVGIVDVHLGVHDKWPLLQALLAEQGIDPGAVAYAGDDLNDLPCLRRVGLPACPQDAAAAVRDSCRFIAPCAGGHGAVRALCDHLIERDLLAS